jgi:alkylhydroperoxidase family enzyme
MNTITRTLALSLFIAGLLPASKVTGGDQPGAGEPTGVHNPRVAVPESTEAWKFLPPADVGAGQPLPVWARALARSMPRTTAAMLDLDRIHRTKSPLGPLLRGKVRWVAAQANRCDYSLATAEADLRRAGLDKAGFLALAGDHAGLPRAEKAALAFAHTMTTSADQVTDAEAAELLSLFGEEKLTAIVLLLAYSNFQDRLLLALDLPLEPGGPAEPPEIRFTKGAAAPPVPPRVKIAGRAEPVVPERIDDPEWLSLDTDDLQRSLSSQRARPSRIRVPAWEEVVKVIPAGSPVPKNPVRIQWSLVCMGYQPELATAWSACTNAFREEAKQDRVFEESLFWVVTRTIHCFY